MQDWMNQQPEEGRMTQAKFDALVQAAWKHCTTPEKLHAQVHRAIETIRRVLDNNGGNWFVQP